MSLKQKLSNGFSESKFGKLWLKNCEETGLTKQNAWIPVWYLLQGVLTVVCGYVIILIVGMYLLPFTLGALVGYASIGPSTDIPSFIITWLFPCLFLLGVSICGAVYGVYWEAKFWHRVFSSKIRKARDSSYKPYVKKFKNKK